jgi:hypothetical protein
VDAHKKSKIEVHLEIQGSVMLLRERQTHNYLGLGPQKGSVVVSALVNRYHATLSAFVQDENTMAIIIYGQRSSADDIGDFLSSNDCFLQEPDDYDSSAEYINPQWLLRPGTGFEASEYQAGGSQPMQSATLDPAAKSKVNAVFDSAYGPTTFSEAHVSSQMRTELKL